MTAFPVIVRLWLPVYNGRPHNSELLYNGPLIYIYIYIIMGDKVLNESSQSGLCFEDRDGVPVSSLQHTYSVCWGNRSDGIVPIRDSYGFSPICAFSIRPVPPQPHKKIAPELSRITFLAGVKFRGFEASKLRE